MAIYETLKSQSGAQPNKRFRYIRVQKLMQSVFHTIHMYMK